MGTIITGEEQIDDMSSFIDDTDRACRNRAIALINCCRLLSRVSRQWRRQYIELRRVLETCDDALRSAACMGDEVTATNQANESFESAVRSLAKYEFKFQSGANVINSWMKRAMRRDLFEVSSVPLPPSPMIVIDFIVFKTLPDPKPVIVRQVLRRGAELDEVLWNFSRFNDNRRITLQDNPHFYLELPTSADAYTGEFRTLPVQDMQLISNSTVYVLVDRPIHVFLETEQETRIFGNVYMLKDVMIFKDIHGTLEGETIVGESIRDTPNLGHYKKSFPSEFPASNLPIYRRGFPPGIMINHTTEWTREDWRELIRRS
ncbi:hypothetical protein BC826DRAFT_82072 [Russula brevipes]|nr:hypothetical protein BC826DRAFT_82072 [Russula brevipes]